MSNRTVIPPPVPAKPPKRGSSGEHRAVKGYRDKVKSITEGTFPELEALNELLESKLQETPPPPEPEAVLVGITEDEEPDGSE